MDKNIGEYYVQEFGAIGDGVVKDTGAIQSAIEQCHAQGGGRVILSGGEFLSGTLHLKSNVELHIVRGAKLIASPDINDYDSDTHHNRYMFESNMDWCFIYAEDASNIALTGAGTIVGNVASFPNDNDPKRGRPMLIRFLRCNHVYLKELSLLDAAAWTTAILDSEYIWVNGLYIYNDTYYNGDGLNFDGCRNVYVSNCFINGTDDNLCLQSSSKEYPVENIQIVNCTFTSLCAAVRVGLKSIGSISGVTIQNCNFYNVRREGIKIECSEGGSITDIAISNIVMRNVRRPIYILLNNTFGKRGNSIELKEIPQIGELSRVMITNLIVTDDGAMGETHLRFNRDIMGSPRFNGIRVDANKNHPIKQLCLENILYTAYGGVSLAEIPEDYPQVQDITECIDETKDSSGNYYPDWSRTVFMDIRNVNQLRLNNVQLKVLHEDERPYTLFDGCDGDLKEGITLI